MPVTVDVIYVFPSEIPLAFCRIRVEMWIRCDLNRNCAGLLSIIVKGPPQVCWLAIIWTMEHWQLSMNTLKCTDLQYWKPCSCEACSRWNLSSKVLLKACASLSTFIFYFCCSAGVSALLLTGAIFPAWLGLLSLRGCAVSTASFSNSHPFPLKLTNSQELMNGGGTVLNQVQASMGGSNEWPSVWANYSLTRCDKALCPSPSVFFLPPLLWHVFRPSLHVAWRVNSELNHKVRQDLTDLISFALIPNAASQPI